LCGEGECGVVSPCSMHTPSERGQGVAQISAMKKRIIKKCTIMVGTTAAGSDAHAIEGNVRAANRTCEH